MQLQIANRVRVTEVEGPHRRAAVWVAGCTLSCPDCCNPELFSPRAGARVTVDELGAWLEAGPPIEGLTLLGGEPLQQIAGATALCKAARTLGLGTIVFTGYTWAAARRRPGFPDLAAQVDTFVAEPFRAHDPELTRRFIGSSNQTLQHMTPRYADEALWRGQNGAEIQVDASGHVSVHGFPTEVRALERRLGLVRL